MSYSKVMAVYPGDRVEDLEELRNAWGTAPVVWEPLCRHYLHMEGYYLDKLDRLWPLWKDPAVPRSRRAVLMFTYDLIYVKREDYARFSHDVESFIRDFPTPPGHANHWPRIAKIARWAEVPALALYCTSVSANPWWGPWNEETEDYGPLKWEDVYDLYEQLDMVSG